MLMPPTLGSLVSESGHSIVKISLMETLNYFKVLQDINNS